VSEQSATAKVPSDIEIAESWHKVHAQLLKGVADAQAKLLAAQNETNDRLEGLAERLTTLTVSAAALNANHASFTGRVEVIEALLAKPRRQVERLLSKQIVKPTQRKR